ncbi:iron dicitrate transport regulator FecR [Mycolicibacterium agri]|uniref:Glutamine--fructose-6-phosphate aminotransferase [isomerizing] n=1 Tax=Mycolicibacterium agri TaxID=36811 RepID=A0A2A7NC37_MYCAG|nr:SIS domain-containing protein [Mycolicibacterium agri]PEG41396.1 iron dicitrate transport regulator FecR [Mycolicibacterium agri]GFG52969.1 sigma factor regulator FecR [Mycolicibacterium agri]
MKPDGFAADLYRKPEVLQRLASGLAAANPWDDVVPPNIERVVLLGMGSSAYAGGVAAARMRARGVVAASELASSPLLPDWGDATLVVATSASGGSAETLDALDRLPASAHTVALTNTPGSPITQRCDAVVDLAAETEVGGVACRSYQHTLALLLALECHLTRTGTERLASAVALAADASAYLLDTESDWRLEVSEPLLGPSGVYLAAPADRLCSAQQGALMLREGPRLPAVGCETGDWSHVDVYLTKTLDYRLLVFAGSKWEAQLAEWTGERGSTVIGVGGVVPGTQYNLRYPGDSDDVVRLLTEVLVPELMAARAWQAQRR